MTGIDWLILGLYFVFVLGIGFALKNSMKTSTDFFLAGRAIPAWVCGLAFMSANLGAQEVIGMGASGAKYGIATSHFYWIGAIPAMVFVGLFMMPFYYGSRARSVPEYLRLRFDEKTRGLNAVSFAIMTIFSSGISMYAIAKLIETLHVFDGLFQRLGLGNSGIFDFSIFVSAVVVLIYIFLGGLSSAIYNEVLQFFLIVAGFLPLSWLELRSVGGWWGLKAKLDPAFTHSWAGLAQANTNPLGVEWFGLVLGLGFVLSFGYWCTDFLVIQRAMTANSMSAARRTPLIGAIPKMLFPFLVDSAGIDRSGATDADRSHAIGHGVDRRTASARTDSLQTRQRGQTDARQRRAATTRLRSRGAEHAVALFPSGKARAGADRTAGEFQVRHGGKRHSIQHGMDLRHLPVLYPAGCQRPALPADGPDGHRIWHRVLSRRGLHGQSL
jgi:solute:Na+ symporter, SSS family